MRLSRTDEIVAGDLFVIWKTSCGDFRGLPLSDLMTYLNQNLQISSSEFTTQYSAPSSNDFSVTISNAVPGANIHLILTPTAGFADGTIILPPSTSAVDKQEVLVNCTQQINTLTIDANGATAVTGEPGTIGADDFFRLKFDAATSTWYRVG